MKKQTVLHLAVALTIQSWSVFATEAENSSRNLRANTIRQEYDFEQHHARRLDKIRGDDVCLNANTSFGICKQCDPNLTLPKYVKKYVYTHQDHPPEYTPLKYESKSHGLKSSKYKNGKSGKSDKNGKGSWSGKGSSSGKYKSGKKNSSGKYKSGKKNKSRVRDLKGESSKKKSHGKYKSSKRHSSKRKSSSSSNQSVAQHDDTEFLDCIPQCPSGYKLCTNRRPRKDGEIYPDGLPKYYIDYSMVRCIPKDSNCSLCTPGRFCRSEMRCIAKGSNYECVDNNGDEAWW
jgi:hypothetical protein